MTLDDMKSRHEALLAARWRGVRSIDVEGRRITYATDAEMASAILSPRGANEAGPWRTSRTPYLREIMGALSPSSPYQRIVFMKGAQLGGSECGNNWVGYIIHHAPGPMLLVHPESKSRGLVACSDAIR